jgi:hypothetical protein
MKKFIVLIFLTILIVSCTSYYVTRKSDPIIGQVNTFGDVSIISFVSLFFVQNVFDQNVYYTTPYSLSLKVIDRLEKEGFPIEKVKSVEGTRSSTGLRLQ